MCKIYANGSGQREKRRPLILEDDLNPSIVAVIRAGTEI